MKKPESMLDRVRRFSKITHKRLVETEAIVERLKLVGALKSVLEASKEGANGEYIRGVIRALDIHELVAKVENGARP